MLVTVVDANGVGIAGPQLYRREVGLYHGIPSQQPLSERS